jgi:hypothetical protein
MNDPTQPISLDDWDARYAELRAAGLCEPPYGGPLRRHVQAGDRRLRRLRLDNSAAALRLWNFLLTEEQRLQQARDRGWQILGTLKDLGTIPVMAYALERVVAFYPDGAWWLPCLMEDQTSVLEVADSLGIDESFCPVRAMLGAFANQAHFPLPDLLTCSVGATCDDVSALAQRLARMGHAILWWEVPHRRRPEPGEEAVELPGGFPAPACQVAFVRAELERIRDALEAWTGQRSATSNCGPVSDPRIVCAVAWRAALAGLLGRTLPAARLGDAGSRDARHPFLFGPAGVDRRAGTVAGRGACARGGRAGRVAVGGRTRVLGQSRGRPAGHEPAGRRRRTHLRNRILVLPRPGSDPRESASAGSAGTLRAGRPDGRFASRSRRADLPRGTRFGAQAVVISRIPGASHCGLEGLVIADVVRRRLGLPVVEIEVPPITDALEPSLRTRLEALIETVAS